MAEVTVSAQKQNLAHVYTIALRKHDYKKEGPAIGSMCPRGPGKVMGTVLGRPDCR